MKSVAFVYGCFLSLVNLHGFCNNYIVDSLFEEVIVNWTPAIQLRNVFVPSFTLKVTALLNVIENDWSYMTVGVRCQDSLVVIFKLYRFPYK